MAQNTSSSQHKINKTPIGGMGRGPRMMRPVEKPKNMKGTVKRLFQYIGNTKWLLYGMLFLTLLITLMNLVTPILQGEAINCITLAEGQLHVDFARLFQMVAWMIILCIVNAIVFYFQYYLAAKLSQTTVRNLRKDLFAKISKLPISYLDSHNHGDIMSRMTNDVENVSNTISSSLASLFNGVITIIGVIVLMLYYSPILTLVAMIAIPLSLSVTTFIAKKTRKYFVQQQRTLGQLNGHVEEMVTGCRTITAFCREKQSIDKFKAYSSELRQCAIRATIFGSIMGPLMNVIGNLTYLLIAGIGGAMALAGSIKIGTIQIFLSYSKQFTRPISEIANLYTSIQTAIAGAERVFAVMDEEIETNEGTQPLEIEKVKGELHFEDVQFAYKKGEPVLKGFDLQVEPGQKIAIVGATGSGKTTVVNLLMRFYEIDAGKITLDGVDIAQIPKDDLRHTIAIVLQDTVLFQDTIRSNIAYGRQDATEEEIRAAAAMANADTFIDRLPQGYDTMLAEAGSNLSQGQRQLLSIARAVLANPKILILDEATSSVDTRTEMNIQKAMIALMKGRTSLIIAHRLSTIRDADKIIVVDGGRICESGNHEQLLARKGQYYKLYQNQFAGKAI